MTTAYFTDLNYTMANEDTSLETSLLPLDSDHVVCVCGSGSRAIPLLSKKPNRLTLVDYSDAQIALTQMRIELLKHCSHQEFLGFLGYEDTLSVNEKKDIYHNLALSPDYKNQLFDLFEAKNWSPLIYMGKYEQMLIKISKLIKLALGDEVHKIFGFKEHNDFLTYYQNDFPHLRWKTLLTLIGNSTVFNALLYKGSHPQKNIPLSYRAYYLNLFDGLFKMLNPQEIFLLQMTILGKVQFPHARPIEADPKIFEQMKAGLTNCEIEYKQGDLIDIIQNQINTPINFISFSDILSYFSGDLEQNYLQWISPKLSSGALTVHRYYLRVNKELQTHGYQIQSGQYTDLIDKERTQIYHIDIYQRD